MPLFLEKSDGALRVQMINLAHKISKYADTLNITEAEITSLQTDAAALDFMVSNQLAVQAFAQHFTAYKKMLRAGSGQVLGTVPELLALGTVPTMPLSPNMEGRVRNLLQRLVHHPAYTKAIGQDLGIEAPEQIFVPRTGKPKFSIVLSSGGYPNLRWRKGKFQGVEIWKDAGHGFVKLDRDMRPDYIDKSSLPKAGESATWSYRMIYLLNDEIIGNWSDVVSVTVFGEV